MRYIGIDYGTKKVGLALSDEAGTMGFPHSILPNNEGLLDAIVALIQKEGVRGIVIGESKDFKGEDNPMAKEARTFVKLLGERTSLPSHFESETLTTAEARRQYTPELKSRAPRQNPDVDDSAAALILTSYLSHPNHG